MLPFAVSAMKVTNTVAAIDTTVVVVFHGDAATAIDADATLQV